MDPVLSPVIVYVSEMDRSLYFYRKVLGLGLISESARYSELDAGEITLALHLSSQEGAERPWSNVPPGHAELNFEVDDIDAACSNLRASGVEVDGPHTLPDTGIMTATLRDPDGLAVQLWEALK